ncbi:MAG: 30S ribosomal protein S13 [Candidatus Woesearchaeota archaeon]
MENQLRHIVRIANTDLPGKVQIAYALRNIKGISFMFANAVCKLAQIDGRRKAGSLNDEEISRLENVIKKPLEFGVPSWLLNRRKDVESGLDKHLIGTDVSFVMENDIKQMKKIKCYKGVRHSLGLPVRGQRTRSNFRKNKGKVLGVKRRADMKAGRT